MGNKMQEGNSFNKAKFDPNDWETDVITEVSEPIIEGKFSFLGKKNVKYNSEYISFSHSFPKKDGGTFTKITKYFKIAPDSNLIEFLTELHRGIGEYIDYRSGKKPPKIEQNEEEPLPVKEIDGDLEFDDPF